MPKQKEKCDNPILNSLSVGDIADLLGLSVQRINQLEREGVIEKEKHGSYNGAECVKAYISYQKSGSGDRARLYRAQAEAKELEVAAAKGEVITIKTLVAALADIFSTITQQTQGLAGRVANELASIDDPGQVRKRLLEEIREVLANCTSKLERLADGWIRAQPSVDNIKAAANQNDDGVGGTKSRATTRKRRTRKVSARKNAVDKKDT